MKNSVLFVAFSLLLTFTDVMSNQPNADVKYCKEIYKRYSTSHTICQPKNPSCDIKKHSVSPEEIEQIVALHNKYRSIIATQGKESNGLPPASNMMYMEWDKELHLVAQQQTDRCIYAHDENDERQVRNFRVGQNIAIKNVGTVPANADWAYAIGQFYSEIKNFHQSQMCAPSFVDFPEERQIGHFTQEVWATSFRVGCGFTMYKEGENYIQLYSCNYGPGGNMGSACMYEKGPACSKCPENTACTKDSQHPGLCQRTNDEAPYTPITVPTIFNCNFRDPKSPDCQFHQEGDGVWKTVGALGGPFLETILQPGQNATIVFHKKVIGTENGAKKMCVEATYSMGPVLAKNPQNSMLKGIFVIPNYSVFMDLAYHKTLGPGGTGLPWKTATEVKISFAVPEGATPQFFDLKSVVAYDNPCPK